MLTISMIALEDSNKRGARQSAEVCVCDRSQIERPQNAGTTYWHTVNALRLDQRSACARSDFGGQE